jgi:predicted nucleic acid-binding Zn finger protein
VTESSPVLSGVNKLIFIPSGTVIWIVVGKDNEHWADPDLKFCTCKDFYFKALSGGPECYHLKSIRQAMEDSKFVTVEFSDDEYVQFLQALIEDEASILGSR